MTIRSLGKSGVGCSGQKVSTYLQSDSLCSMHTHTQKHLGKLHTQPYRSSTSHIKLSATKTKALLPIQFSDRMTPTRNPRPKSTLKPRANPRCVRCKQSPLHEKSAIHSPKIPLANDGMRLYTKRSRLILSSSRIHVFRVIVMVYIHS